MRPRCPRDGRYCRPDGTHAYCGWNRWRNYNTDRYAPLEDAQEAAKNLVRVYGSVQQAGYAVSTRHGLAAESGQRLLQRILHGHVKAVRESTLDRLSVIL
jgi:hypothetical protein